MTTPGQPIELLRADDVLGPVVDEHGPVSLEPADDIFARLITSIVRQQVSMEAARSIRSRLFDGFEITPEALADADPEALQSVGLSQQKATYVRSVATAFREEGYDRATFAAMDDDAIVDELTDIRGVGDWTAKMFLMFCLGREDVFPVEDLGIRKGMAVLFEEDLTWAGQRERAERWCPYRSYASLYLWRISDG